MTACSIVGDGLIHELRVGFTLPAMVAVLYRGDDTPVDLTDATSVRWVMHRRGRSSDPAKIDRAITILTPRTDGRVRVDFVTGDVDVSAVYDGFFVVTYTDGNTLPVPNPGFITVTVGR